MNNDLDISNLYDSTSDYSRHDVISNYSIQPCIPPTNVTERYLL